MRLSAVFIAVAAMISGARAGDLNGNFSHKFELAIKDECKKFSSSREYTMLIVVARKVGPFCYKGLQNSSCDVVTCALTIGKANDCLLQAAIDESMIAITKCIDVTNKVIHSQV